MRRAQVLLLMSLGIVCVSFSYFFLSLSKDQSKLPRDMLGESKNKDGIKNLKAVLEADVDKQVSAQKAYNSLAITDAELPTSKALPVHEVAQVVSLWDVDFSGLKENWERIDIKASLIALSQLEFGKIVRLKIPGSSDFFESTINKRRRMGTNVVVLNGESSEEIDNLTIVRGAIETQLTIIDGYHVYTAYIDNKTGATTFINEAELNSKRIPYEDGIPAPPDELAQEDFE